MPGLGYQVFLNPGHDGCCVAVPPNSSSALKGRDKMAKQLNSWKLLLNLCMMSCKSSVEVLFDKKARIGHYYLTLVCIYTHFLGTTYSNGYEELYQ
jgi:hypothetical protein